MSTPTFADAHAALARDETSCLTLVSSFLDRIAADNARLNALVHVDADAARAQARQVDERRAQGDDLPLAGLVLAVKDNLCRVDAPASCGSRMLEGFVSLFDATAVARLRAAGAVFIGTANCDEFAMGSSNETSVYGPARNPHDPERVPGGSSGGSAAAVAAGFCHAALGSDTGGSVRQPAAFCGVVGLKPTYGRVSRSGLVAFASSLDVVGPLAHTVEDAAAVLQAMAGVDARDATSAPEPVPDYRSALTGSVEGVRIGLPAEFRAEGLDPAIRARVEETAARLRDAGAHIIEVSLPHTRYGVAAYYVLAAAEASSNLGRYDGVRYGYRANLQASRRAMESERRALEGALAAARADGDDARVAEAQAALDAQGSALDRLYTDTRTEGFGDEVKRRIMLGTYVLSAGYYDAYYAKAQRVRRLIRDDFARAFEAVDVLLTPATPTPPFRLGERLDDPLAMYLNDVYTVTANLAGIPGLVVPAGTHPNGLPVGVQLLGPPFGEARLLQVGDVVMKL